MQAEKLRKDVYMPFFQVPEDLRKVGRVFYQSKHLEFFYFEALPNKKDCYISARCVATFSAVRYEPFSGNETKNLWQ